ncbi:metal ABC transporter substrate-binding protein [Paenibacillus sp. TRM 82003]|nr:metal ABC transporter substrate-binding protein [Paenibacillus sp. TRM 82003]
MKCSVKSIIVSLGLVAVLLVGCTGGKVESNGQAEWNGQPESNGQVDSSKNIKVAASIYPMYEFASKVGGELAEVNLLVPAGVEPHDWEPAPKDLAFLESADVLVFNGSGMEGWVEQVVGSLDNTRLLLIETSHQLELLVAEESVHENEHAEEEAHANEHGHAEEAHADEHGHAEEAHADEHGHEEEVHAQDHGKFDPHVWLSPVQAMKQVRSIEAAFAEAAPDHKDTFKANADAYIAELEQLDQRFKDALAPYRGKEFVTQHAAFAHEYGLLQLPIAGLSPENEPSAERMAEIVDFAKEHDVRTIFFETLASSKVAEAIASEIGASTSVLHPIEYITEEEWRGGMDYVKLMNQNLEALRKAFEQ